jgi:hypothetical protein
VSPEEHTFIAALTVELARTRRKFRNMAVK